MNTELEVLKKILKEKEKIPVRLISNHLGYGTDYIRFICQKLEERNLVKVLSRDWYKITAKGEKELERRGLIKRSPRKGLKMKSSVWQVVKMKDYNSRTRAKLGAGLIPHRNKVSGVGPPATQKLKIGKTIEKVASFLGKLRF